MNANEFADELEKAPTLWFKDDVAGKWIVEKLRQQQEQIDKLTAIVALRELKIERMIENQSHHEGIAHAGGFEAGYQAAKAKTLTDEEILEIWNQHSKYGAVISVYDFAKAILRKAQEK